MTSNIPRFTPYQASADPFALAAAFQELQDKLPGMWREIGSTDPGGAPQEETTVVAVPSISVDMEIPTVQQQGFEERFLFLLFLLEQTNLRLIYVTSQPVLPEIIDYYLDILPGVVSSNARKRLFMVSPNDGSHRPLSEKLLERPRLMQQLRDLIGDPENAHIVPFNTTDLERDLALQLGIPMYAADPACFALGTKSGGRQLFTEEGIEHALGFENLFSEEAVLQALIAMRREKPSISHVILKLNEGVGGLGNATIDLQDLPGPGEPEEEAAVIERIRQMHLEEDKFFAEDYMQILAEDGGIVEEFISGEEVHSPSVQMRNTPLGEVQILSTHDQLLGGPTGQLFLGAVFPANPDYVREITIEAEKIGARLAKEGVVGRFAVDFLVTRREDGGWNTYAIEINLRKGGTTTPYLTLQYLTRGNYDPEKGLFYTLRGHEKFYVASDHLGSDFYRGYTPKDLFEVLSMNRLHFNHTSQTGIVLHMFSGVGTYGKLGLTAIGNTPLEAQSIYDTFQDLLDRG